MSGYIRQRPYPVPFQIVHDSAEGKKASEGAVDIVAIHGLGANPETTWLDWTTGVSVNWLKDLLPKHPGIPYARIICFNFDSRWFGSDLPKQTLRGIALQLLDHLNNQKSDKQRPTIFVAHSLGGVILEKALVLANSDGNQYQHLVKTTGGIIFLGTPFRGSSDASQKLSSIIGTIASFVGSTEKGLLEYSVQSESLSELLTDFTEIASRNWLNTGSVFCFYELYESTFSIKKLGIPYEMKTKVVDEISGTIDGAIPIPANVNHFNFNKFGNDQDETYIKISEKITKLSSQAWKVVNANLRRLGQEISEEKRIKTLNWLWHGDFQTRHKDIREERCEGTGEWFLSSDKYLSWICGKSSPILWCDGMPGAGKTFMTSFVLDNLEDRLNQENIAIAFIYFNYQDQEEQNPTKVIACLVKQLISRKTSLPKKIIECYEKLSKETKVPDFPQLLDLLRSLSLEYSTIWIVLDAIDECKEGTRDKVLSSLLVLDPQFFRLFITTRPHPKYPETICKAREAALKIEITPSQTDLKVYTRQKLENAKQNLQQGFIDMAVSKLVIGADGMFLFLALQINNILEQTSQRGMKRTLDKTPTSLNDLYDLMVKKIDGEAECRRILAKKALAWISLSKRPLKKEELVEALAVEEGDKDLDRDNITGIDLIVDVCAGLVTNDWNSGTVRLVHKTTQDYFSAKSIIPKRAHVDITKTCITYLSFNCFDQIAYKPKIHLISLMREYKFLDYAIRSWHFHLKDAGECDPQLSYQFREFLKSGDKWGSYLGFHDGKIFFYDELVPRPPLHFAVISGLPTVVKSLLDTGPDAYLVEEMTRSDQIFLCAISMGGNTTFELLLDHGRCSGWLKNMGSPMRISGIPPLHTAALLGRETIVGLLLDRGADIESRDYNHWTPLYQAARGGHQTTVKLLLDRGADIEARNHYQRTPLYQAVYQDNHAMVKLLLDQGADIEARDRSQKTPLHHAVSQNNQPMVKLLSDRGADIKRIYHQKTPLHQAISYNDQGMIKLLLDQGADIEARDSCQQTPLHKAVSCNMYKIVELLLNLGANIEARDSSQKTPLYKAVSQNSQEMIILLLNRGADIEAKDIDQRTPLHQAAFYSNETIPKLRLDQGTILEDSDSSYYGQWESRKQLVGDPPLDRGKGKEQKSLHLVALLLDRGANIEARNMDQQTLVHKAVSCDNQAMVKLLLDRGVDIEARDSSGKTPLHQAVAYKNKEISRLLLDRGADIEARDSSGKTPLHQAVAYNNGRKISRLLLDRGADIEARDSSGKTPLHQAVAHDNGEIFWLLLHRGADIEARDSSGKTPLHQAVAYNNGKEISRLLLHRGADIEARDSSGKTPLHQAVAHDNEEISWLLLHRGADIEARDSSGKTPLHQAVARDNQEIIKLLLDRGADIEAKYIDQQTLVHKAVSWDDYAIVKLLLDRGAGIEARDSSGKTPLHQAVTYNKKIIVKLLLDRGADIEARDNNQQTPLHISIPVIKLPLDLGNCFSRISWSLNIAKLLLDRGADIEARDGNGKTLHQAIIHEKEVIAKLLFEDNGQYKNEFIAIPNLYNKLDKMISSRRAKIKAIDGGKEAVQREGPPSSYLHLIPPNESTPEHLSRKRPAPESWDAQPRSMGGDRHI